MSAYICTHAHINAIVYWASTNTISVRALEVRKDPQATAEVLYAENVASANYRYKENEPTGLYRPIEIIKLCNSLDYQSCEHPDWEASHAKALLDKIRQTAITKLPGYDEAPWGI